PGSSDWTLRLRKVRVPRRTRYRTACLHRTALDVMRIAPGKPVFATSDPGVCLRLFAVDWPVAFKRIESAVVHADRRSPDSLPRFVAPDELPSEFEILH